MSGWTVVTLRARESEDYDLTDGDSHGPWAAMSDITATMDADGRLRRWTAWSGHVYAYLGSSNSFESAEAFLADYAEMVQDAVVLRANNTTDVGTARYYPDPENGHWTDHYAERQDDGETFVGELALATMNARHGLIARDPFHNKSGILDEEYLEYGVDRLSTDERDEPTPVADGGWNRPTCPFCTRGQTLDGQGKFTREIRTKTLDGEGVNHRAESWTQLHCPDCGQVFAVRERVVQETVTGDAESDDSDQVTVDREALEELVNTAKGDLERLVTSDGFREGDDVVDDLAETIEAAEASLQDSTAHNDVATDGGIEHARECESCGAETYQFERCHACGDVPWKGGQVATDGGHDLEALRQGIEATVAADDETVRRIGDYAFRAHDNWCGSPVSHVTVDYGEEPNWLVIPYDFAEVVTDAIAERTAGVEVDA